jgi:hypothetical protein
VIQQGKEHRANRDVAMIDILGFRSLLASDDLLQIVERVHALLRDAQAMLTAHIGSSTGESRTRTLGEVHFSDTIMLWTPAIADSAAPESEAALGHLLRAVTFLLYESFLKGMPLRAGIAFGECYMDPANDIFVGRAIADAYELESAQDWAGGAVHTAVRLGTPGMGCLKDYSVPLKPRAKVRTRIALNWPDIPDSPEGYHALKRAVAALLDRPLDPNARTKLQHTWKFLNQVYSGIRFRQREPNGSFRTFNPTKE